MKIEKKIEKEKKCVEIIGKDMNEYFLFFFVQQETHVMRLRYFFKNTVLFKL